VRAFVRAIRDERRFGTVEDLAHLPGGIGGHVDLVVLAVVAADEADEFVDKCLEPLRRARQPELARWASGRLGQDDRRSGADQFSVAFIADLENGAIPATPCLVEVGRMRFQFDPLPSHLDQLLTVHLQGGDGGSPGRSQADDVSCVIIP
jgi:hypothetical protein